VRDLTDDNPYDVLGLDLNADGHAIKQAAFGREGAGRSGETGKDRRRLRRAYDSLRSPEKRIVVDALTPNFANDFDGDRLVAEFCDEIGGPPDWLSYLDRSTILKQDLQALIEATLRHTFAELPEPQCQPELLAEYDGLEDFLKEWLR
jgi:hypothetical protein